MVLRKFIFIRVIKSEILPGFEKKNTDHQKWLFGSLNQA